MTKNRRLEIRLSDDEYEAFEARAEELDVSLSEAVRQSLIPAALSEGPRSFVRGAIDAAMSPKGHPDLGRAGDEAAIQKRFKQLVAQLQSRMSLEDAEDEARKRLGMDG